MNPKNKRNVIGKQIDSMICIDEPSTNKLTLKCIYCGDIYDTGKGNFVSILDGKLSSNGKLHYYCKNKLCTGSNPSYHPKLPKNLSIVEVIGGGKFSCKCNECGKINTYCKVTLELWDEICKNEDCNVAIRHKKLVQKHNSESRTYSRSIPIGYKTDSFEVIEHSKGIKGYKCKCNSCSKTFNLSVSEVKNKKPHCTNKNCRFYGRSKGIPFDYEVNGFRLVERLNGDKCIVECLSCHSKFERNFVHFKNSLVRCPSLACQNKDKIGVVVKLKSGLEIEVIDYINSSNIRVKFLIDGTEVTTTVKQVFVDKCLTHPNKEIMKQFRVSKYVGEEFSTKSGEKVKVIDGDTVNTLVIQFNDGSTLDDVHLDYLRRGSLDFRLFKRYLDKISLTNPTLFEGTTYYDCTCKKCGFSGTFSKKFIDKHIEECYSD